MWFDDVLAKAAELLKASLPYQEKLDQYQATPKKKRPFLNRNKEVDDNGVAPSPDAEPDADDSTGGE